MGVKLKREKPRRLFQSVIYRFIKLPLSKKTKLKLFLDLEWMFNRLSNEISFNIYEHHKHPWKIQASAFILDFIEPEHNVLDLGCGNGEIAYLIAGKAKKVVGIDHNQVKLNGAQKNYSRENLSFLCMDVIEYLKNTDETFDVLILSHILEHIDEPEDFLEKFKGFFRYIYIEVPDFDATILNHYRQDFDLELIHTDNDHVREFDRYELQELFGQCRLKVLRSEYILGIQRFWCEVT